jgi:hypothetical protein
LQPVKPQVTVNVGKIDRVFGERIVRNAKRNSERGLFKNSSISAAAGTVRPGRHFVVGCLQTWS